MAFVSLQPAISEAIRNMKAKPKIAIVRGKFLNKYEMQSFEPLVSRFNLTGFGSLTPFHDKFSFPVIKLPCPMDLPEFPYKMPIINRLFTDAHYLYGLEEKLKGFDLAHSAETYFHYTQQCLNAKKRGYVKKVIATVLENIPFNNEGIRDRKKFKKRARLELDHIIALTNRTKEALILEGADPDRITVIGHGINTAEFRPSSKFTRSTSSGQSSKLNKINILFVGRLEFYKGVYEVIYAAKKLLTDEDLSAYNLKFTLVGNGSEKEKLTQLGEKLGIESFVKHKKVSYDKMPLEYQNADIFVAPSRAVPTYQEQYNTALLEAQSAGLPIVTTLSGGITENVGDAAVLVPPGDFLSLFNAIKSFILNPKLREEYSKRARKRALEVHDAKIISKKIADVYNSLL